MKKSHKVRKKNKGWIAKEIKVEYFEVEEKMMNQILDEVVELLYNEFASFQKINDSFPQIECSLNIKEAVS